MGELALGSWRERVGERAYQEAGDGAGWLRVASAQTRQDDRSRQSDGLDGAIINPRFESQQDLLQVGMDVHQQYAGDDLRIAAGFYLGATRGRADVWHHDIATGKEEAAGRIRADDRHMGVYWTGMNASQAYVDLVMQYSSGKHKLRGSELHNTTKSRGLAMSVEVGQQFSPSDAWTITPQAQLSWQQVNLNEVQVQLQGARVGTYHFDDPSSLRGRVGVAARYQRDSNWATWGRLDVTHQFEGHNTVRYSSRPSAPSPRFTSDVSGTGYAATLGADVRLGGSVDLFGSAGYQGSLSGPMGSGWQARLGLRVNW